MEDKFTARAMGERRRLQPASNIGIREYFRNTKKKRRKGGKAGDIGQLVAGSHD